MNPNAVIREAGVPSNLLNYYGQTSIHNFKILIEIRASKPHLFLKSVCFFDSANSFDSKIKVRTFIWTIASYTAFNKAQEETVGNF